MGIFFFKNWLYTKVLRTFNSESDLNNRWHLLNHMISITPLINHFRETLRVPELHLPHPSQRWWGKDDWTYVHTDPPSNVTVLEKENSESLIWRDNIHVPSVTQWGVSWQKNNLTLPLKRRTASLIGKNTDFEISVLKLDLWPSNLNLVSLSVKWW